jgi:aminoglycoside 3-N-acetyltransferase
VKTEVPQSTVVQQLGELGVPQGEVVLVHTSYSAVGPIEGGPGGLIDALLAAVGKHGTLVMPSWTDEDDEVFDPRNDDVEDHLGIVADTFWRRPGVLRGDHPFAMAAVGDEALTVTSSPFILPPHARGSGVATVHDLDGLVLLLGVTHDADSTVHYGELVVGVPYRSPKHITVVEHGRPKRIDYGENDHCCRNFAWVGDWLRARGLQHEGPVGHGHAMLARSRHIVKTVVEELRDDSCRFLCARGSGCVECEETWRSVG